MATFFTRTTRWLRNALQSPRRPGSDRLRVRPTLEQLEDRRLLQGIPVFSSPGRDHASVTLYLDFSGNHEALWSNSKGSFLNVDTPPFDIDGNPSSFSDAETALMLEICQRVAEAFSPFDINVTTMDPGNRDHGKTLVVAIGGSNSDWYELLPASQKILGVSCRGGFADPIGFNTCFVFSKDMYDPSSDTNAQRIAAVVCHEAGHEFGLYHHSTYNADGTLAQEYNPGNADVSPIMGGNRTGTRFLWGIGWAGSGKDPSNPLSGPFSQNDLDKIANYPNGPGYYEDGIGHGMTSAFDIPKNQMANGFAMSGVIVPADPVVLPEGSSQGDYYTFSTTQTSDLSVTVSVPPVGATLAPWVWLLDSAGDTYDYMQTSGPQAVTLTEKSLAPGKYYVLVGGQPATSEDIGHHITVYPDVGSYTVTGYIIPSQGAPGAVIAHLAAAISATQTGTISVDNESNMTDPTSTGQDYLIQIDNEVMRVTGFNTDHFVFVDRGSDLQFPDKGVKVDPGHLPTPTAHAAGAAVILLPSGPDPVKPSTPNQTYVSAVYQAVLGRAPDAAGLASWSGQLDKGMSRAQFASALTHSPEYFSNIVTIAYQRYLGRTPAAAEVNGWVGAMQGGLRDEQLEAAFIGSAEYIQAHGGNGPAWVQGMYQDLLGRPPAMAEVDGWVLAMAHGMSPTQVAYGFAASAEREGQHVTADYQRYLGRPPSASEVGGWVNYFEQGARNEDVVAGFVGSDEYFGAHS